MISLLFVVLPKILFNEEYMLNKMVKISNIAFDFRIDMKENCRTIDLLIMASLEDFTKPSSLFADP